MKKYLFIFLLFFSGCYLQLRDEYPVSSIETIYSIDRYYYVYPYFYDYYSNTRHYYPYEWRVSHKYKFNNRHEMQPTQRRENRIPERREQPSTRTPAGDKKSPPEPNNVRKPDVQQPTRDVKRDQSTTRQGDTRPNERESSSRRSDTKRDSR